MLFADLTEFKTVLESSNPEAFVEHALFDRVPYIFDGDRAQYVLWKRELAKELEVDAACLTIVGTRSLTLPTALTSCEELTGIALGLRERVEMGPKQLFRLVGVGLSNFQIQDEEPSRLFNVADPNAAVEADELVDLPLAPTL
jgi:hypothetical protein